MFTFSQILLQFSLCFLIKFYITYNWCRSYRIISTLSDLLLQVNTQSMFFPHFTSCNWGKNVLMWYLWIFFYFTHCMQLCRHTQATTVVSSFQISFSLGQDLSWEKTQVIRPELEIQRIRWRLWTKSVFKWAAERREVFHIFGTVKALLVFFLILSQAYSEHAVNQIISCLI